MRPLLTLLALLLLSSACAARTNLDKAAHVQAFAPDGSSRDVPDERMFSSVPRTGLVIAYQPGDLVEVDLALDTNFVMLQNARKLTLRVEQPLWVYSGPGGIWVSTDGERFTPWRDAISGGFSLGLGLNGGAATNTASVKLGGRLH